MNNVIDKNLKFIVYLRRSQDREDQQTASIPAQKRELQEFAIKNKLNIVDILQEDMSAYHPGRPIFNKMIHMIENGEANAVLAWSTSRVSRNAEDAGKFIQMISDGKILELRTTNKVYLNNADDIFVLHIALSMDQKSSDEKKQYVYTGNRQRISEGNYPGTAKQGYLNFIDPISKVKSIIIDEVRFPLIQSAFNKILYEGYTPKEALKWLNDNGYKTRLTAETGNKPINASSWYRMLSDEFYYGYINRKEGAGWGKHKPMISIAEYDKLQVILGRKNRPTTIKHEFPYKDLLKCGGCGGSVTAHLKIRVICANCKEKFAKTATRSECPYCKTSLKTMKNPKSYEYVYYNCTKKVTPTCTEGSIRSSTLETDFINLLNRFKISEDYKNLAIEFLNENSDVDLKVNEAVEQNLLKQVQDIKTELKNLLKLKISPLNSTGELLSDESFKDQKTELEKKLKDSEELLTDNGQQFKEKVEEAIEAFNFATYATYWFNEGTPKQKTEIMRKLGLKLEIKDRKLHIYGETPYFLIEKGKEEIEGIKQEFETKVNAGVATNNDLQEAINQSWRTK